jgi:glycosyltransferase involved in cell wall biosynthesis
MNEMFKPVDNVTRKHIQQKYTDGKPYFVFVGALHPRKNLANLFKAYDDFRKNNDTNVLLVIVGKKKWWTENIRLAYEEMEYKDDVRFIGRLQAEELQQVIASALAMTYVSYFEGFGIPIVEAFRCDTAVITSNITSMPEVAADAALLVDPFSITSISDALRKITFDHTLREDLIAKGRVRREHFSWQLSADRLWASIEKALANDKKIEH